MFWNTKKEDSVDDVMLEFTAKIDSLNKIADRMKEKVDKSVDRIAIEQNRILINGNEQDRALAIAENLKGMLNG